jgi:hypothetical protein
MCWKYCPDAKELVHLPGIQKHLNLALCLMYLLSLFKMWHKCERSPFSQNNDRPCLSSEPSRPSYSRARLFRYKSHRFPPFLSTQFSRLEEEEYTLLVVPAVDGLSQVGQVGLCQKNL